METNLILIWNFIISTVTDALIHARMFSSMRKEDWCIWAQQWEFNLTIKITPKSSLEEGQLDHLTNLKLVLNVNTRMTLLQWLSHRAVD